MIPAHDIARRARRGALAFSAAALAAGTAGALMTVPAHADSPSAPSRSAYTLAASHDTSTSSDSAARLRKVVDEARVLKSRKATRGTFSATPGGKSTTGTTSTTGSSGPTATPQIIGGTDATISEAPWMAQLYYLDDQGTADTSDDTIIFCGGTVVSPSKILTAGHCASGMDWASNGFVVTGTDQFWLDAVGDPAGSVISGVTRQWVNPSYNATTTDNDVAVLTLVEPVTTKTLSMTSANDTTSYTAGKTATVYGWGRNSSTTQDQPLQLQKATLPIDTDSTCTSYWGSLFKPGHMVCVGDAATGSDAGTVSPCNGDSGGPLVEGGRIVGIVSWGVEDCVAQGARSVFTKVSTYVPTVNPRLDDASWNEDGLGDLIARTPTGSGYIYYSTGSGLASREYLGDLSGLNLVRQTDLNRDSYEDAVVRTTDGKLYFLDAYSGDSVLVGGGWGVMRSITLPGDLTGDGLPDLFATDSSGAAYVYPGNGKGTFGSRVKIGTGWQTYGAVIYGKGDLTNDGHPDIVARDGSGNLWLYKGTGKASAPWAARVKIGGGWGTYTAFAAVGDLTGDGKADLIGRDSAGKLWLYKGTGSSTAPYAARVLIGTGGWNAYNLFG
ncbi:trypsin-like serine protease [Streptomyces sp. HPF1205]|uniref:trypsin-like serine protease n=1 Tax=Streptomyces sp. HPF1205 TaxID=2873262 RepID=UPI001CEC453C|nr:trypsin-like serine protease [Streptomyces sp. HPF1205]